MVLPVAVTPAVMPKVLLPSRLAEQKVNSLDLSEKKKNVGLLAGVFSFLVSFHPVEVITGNSARLTGTPPGSGRLPDHP